MHLPVGVGDSATISGITKPAKKELVVIDLTKDSDSEERGRQRSHERRIENTFRRMLRIGQAANVSDLDRLESDWKWPGNAKGARMKRCERELLSSDWRKLGLFGKSNSIPTTLMLNTLSGSK
ncbi:hypothetical protein PIB30_037437 [Stylosanthes scabra]|uniref:Uncharacterized protein n=1 Tax=Stylosanthes scabra TaxID=79078 RepID=A0ABU6RE42_9FABA|nr:hypothetical protein [Stylosanthes scabra]